MRYQIRTNNHGLALVEADNPLDALMTFFREQGWDGNMLEIGITAEKNAMTWKGVLYYTDPSV